MSSEIPFPEHLKTPCFVIDEKRLLSNLRILKDIQDSTGCKILLAQKAFSMYSTYPLLSNYLAGTTASGLFEAKLGAEHFHKETHVFSPAYRADEFDELLLYADHISFNSPSQVRKYGKKAKDKGKTIGLRVNPECSTQEGHAIYDPCAPGSRLGTTLSVLKENEDILPLLDGLHFHTLCEQNSDDLETTVRAFEEKFRPYLLSGKIRWLNLGGGHHITRSDYDIDRLIRIINYLQETYQVQIYLEPGEAVVLNAGFLYTRVLETLHNHMELAIVDTSAACHMPDVLEMPYRPPLKASGMPDEKPYTYRLGGPTCLAGDIIGDYSFDHPLKEGDLLIFEDMALYTMVKTNTFNGMNLPDLIYRDSRDQYHLIKRFGYEDFKSRL